MGSTPISVSTDYETQHYRLKNKKLILDTMQLNRKLKI